MSSKVTYIECKTYTDYTPQFGLYKEQDEVVRKWMKDHDAERHIAPGHKSRYTGAVGGAYTFKFTGTSIGLGIHVQCSCGEEIDVSDYDNW